MQASMLRGATPLSSRPSAAGMQRAAAPSRMGAVTVRAVQDLKGTVVSSGAFKTAVVSVERLAPHAKYFKRIRSTKRYTVQDENNVCKVGDYVRLEGCRPLSKNKRFTVAEVVREAK